MVTISGVRELNNPKEDAHIPPIVLELARKEGKQPWSWFICPVYVSIVYADGHKVRYDGPTGYSPNAKPAAAGAKEIPAAAPKLMKVKPRTSKKK